jgi:hypothetical protein
VTHEHHRHVGEVQSGVGCGAVVVPMDHVRQKRNEVECIDNHSSARRDLVADDARARRIDAHLVAAPTQAEFEVAHHDLGTGSVIELNVCDQDSHTETVTSCSARAWASAKWTWMRWASA